MDATGGPVAGGAAVGVPEPVPRHAPSRLLPAWAARQPLEVSLAATIHATSHNRNVGSTVDDLVRDLPGV